MIVVVEFKQNDPTIGRRCIENDGQAAAGFVRIGSPDAGPHRTAFGGAFDGIGNENGIGGHVRQA